ncbi:hypothetical protein AC579_3662 [Pseudocercospora musae]|uniref:Uncharacterized protein n=1 Tax=Pseudocercospora musae TaxID=113226 RepID=A0A139IIY4_9PEZI|nr:hypothetical protein AC579_3662 [Pseudocercospora musae]
MTVAKADRAAEPAENHGYVELRLSQNLCSFHVPAAKPAKMGLDQSEACAKQEKHKDTLDISLLCSKLEEFKREQDAHRLRKEKRNAVRNGYYVPRSAATHFAATATPMGSKPAKRRSHGKHLQPIHEPEHTAETFGRGSLATAHDESQRDDDSDEQEKRDSMFTRAEKDRPKEDHPARKSRIMPRGSRPIAVIIPERRSSSTQQESSPDSIVKVAVEREEEVEERGRSRYRPGDAAKRRQSVMENFPQGRNNTAIPIPDHYTTEPPHRPISFYAIQDLRAARSILDNEVHEPLEESRNNSVTHQYEPKYHPQDSRKTNSVTHQHRPKLALDPRDRPNWSQKSESGDGMRHHPLSFFSSGRQRPVTEETYSQRAKDRTRQGSDHAVPRRQGSILEGHLIADAVKIIQRQERLKKRQSVMGFFKRL